MDDDSPRSECQRPGRNRTVIMQPVSVQAQTGVNIAAGVSHTGAAAGQCPRTSQSPVTGNGYLGTAPVHAFAANGYGLLNVAGNVWEWCEDTFSPRYHQVTASENPFHGAPAPNRSLRGGSFLCHDSYCNRYRVAARARTPRIALRAISDFGSRAAVRREWFRRLEGASITSREFCELLAQQTNEVGLGIASNAVLGTRAVERS